MYQKFKTLDKMVRKGIVLSAGLISLGLAATGCEDWTKPDSTEAPLVALGINKEVAGIILYSSRLSQPEAVVYVRMRDSAIVLLKRHMVEFPNDTAAIRVLALLEKSNEPRRVSLQVGLIQQLYGIRPIH